jgi:hypothetical protein
MNPRPPPPVTRTLPVMLLSLLLFGLPSRPAADERMNAQVGIFYSSRNLAGFEYDLIAQFWKSQEWMGNITGPFVSEEIYWRANRLGLGFVTGKRAAEKGTFAASVQVFEENRYSDFSTFHYGGEAKITLMILGLKVGLLDWKKAYFEAGLSY